MRTSRILGEGTSFYHVISRVNNREHVFKPKDKSIFRKIMRKVEAFSGVHIITYAILDNHFHLLVEVPDKETSQPLNRDEMLKALSAIYDKNTVYSIEDDMNRAEAERGEAGLQEVLDRYEVLRCDLAQFMKKLKQRVTFYMNKEHDRTGTLWEGRYKSVLVEPTPVALLTTAAYIDLNPVRAGIVSEPEDYHWSGYAEAVSGRKKAKKKARAGICQIWSTSTGGDSYKWKEAQALYRKLLYEEGAEVKASPETGERGRRGFTAEQVEKVIDQGGVIPMSSLLRFRVRYFTDGAVFGAAEFVESVFRREKAKGGRFSQGRKTGSRPMAGADWGGLCVLRELRKEVIAGKNVTKRPSGSSG